MRPLENQLVLDLSRVLSGPFCTQQLADMGARVIKIESKKGDDTRRFGPPFLAGESTYFLSINRGKQSLVLDLKHKKGKEIAKLLAQKADILIENFRPGVAKRLGLGFEELFLENARLIYASISGFGQEGLEEYCALPGYDLVIQGLSGIPSLTGDPLGPPYKTGTSIADLVSGLYALQGILLALYAREKTGKGQFIDISMLDAQLSLLSYQAGIYFATGKSPTRKGNQHPSITPYESYQAKDGYVNVAVGNDALYQKLTDLLKEPALKEPRFLQNQSRVKYRDELHKILSPIFASRTVKEWVSLLSQNGIPAGPILEVGDALEHPQAIARNMVIQNNHPKAGKIKMLGSALKLSNTPPLPEGRPPLLGEHTDSILQELLGFSKETIQTLRKEGVIE